MQKKIELEKREKKLIKLFVSEYVSVYVTRVPEIKTALFESDKLCIHRPLGCYRDIYIHLSNKEIKWISLSRLVSCETKTNGAEGEIWRIADSLRRASRSQAALHKAPELHKGLEWDYNLNPIAFHT